MVLIFGQSETDIPPPVLGTMKTSLKQIAGVIRLTVEGMSMRSIHRITKVNLTTIQLVIKRAGRHADMATDRAIDRNGGVWCNSLQIDEMLDRTYQATATEAHRP